MVCTSFFTCIQRVHYDQSRPSGVNFDSCHLRPWRAWGSWMAAMSFCCLLPSFLPDRLLWFDPQEIADQDIPWTIFVETTLPDGWSPAGPAILETNSTAPPSFPCPSRQNHPLPPFDKDCDVLLFFKYFEPISRTLSYVTHLYCPISLRMRDMFPRLRQLAGLPPQTPILLYEEVKPTMVEAIEDVDAPLEKVWLPWNLVHRIEHTLVKFWL